MRRFLARLFHGLSRSAARTSRRKPEGEAGIHALGHRKYVGGNWEQMGALQFEFLLGRGLQPHHVFVDIACGSLRAGVLLIPWLDAGRYFGIEKEAELVRRGLEEELPADVRAARRPQILVSSAFEFDRLGARPDFGIAQSLFSHLPPALIRQCLGKLRPVMADGGTLFATFFETERPVAHDDAPHDHGDFRYTRREMEQFGVDAGWTPEYIGAWGHPRGQHMIAYHAR